MSDNLITVCANCHSTLEAVYNDLFWARAASLEFSIEDLEIGLEQQSNLMEFSDGRERTDGAGRQEQKTQIVGIDREVVERKARFDILRSVYEHDEIEVTQASLAEFSGYSQQRISNIMNDLNVVDEADPRIQAAGEADAIEREVVERKARFELLERIYEHDSIDTTQRTLAECADVTPQRLSSVLNGDR